MIEAKFASLKGTKPHEYVVRFMLGGLVTALAGLIARRYGPVIGGLFLAFPAILPATATLLEKHEREVKEQAHVEVGKRGRMVAGVDAGGAALGTLGLVVFALILWRGLPGHPVWEVLVGASSGWLVVSTGLWWLRRRV